ncbi:TATA-box-binding protein [Candidatus Harpocratesius sp.]
MNTKSSHTPQNSSTNERKTPNKLILRIENIVATINLHCPINLTILAEKFKDIEKKENFPGVITKFSKPKATLLIFSSGKIVVTGVRLEKHIPIIMEKTLKKLSLAGITLTSEPDIRIENMVGRADFQTKINLDLSSLMLERAIYEPEVFPGLIYKIPEPNKICFLIFSSGKVICTGANNLATIQSSLKKLAIQLKKNDLFNTGKLNSIENNTDADTEMLDL